MRRVLTLAALIALLAPVAALAATAAEPVPGMPQLAFGHSLQGRYLIAQVVWLFVIFGFLYYVMTTYALPRVESVLEERRMRIEADLDAARAAKSEADAAMAAHRDATAKARAEAQAAIATAMQQAQAEAAGMAAGAAQGAAERLSPEPGRQVGVFLDEADQGHQAVVAAASHLPREPPFRMARDIGDGAGDADPIRRGEKAQEQELVGGDQRLVAAARPEEQVAREHHRTRIAGAVPDEAGQAGAVAQRLIRTEPRRQGPGLPGIGCEVLQAAIGEFQAGRPGGVQQPGGGTAGHEVVAVHQPHPAAGSGFDAQIGGTRGTAILHLQDAGRPGKTGDQGQ